LSQHSLIICGVLMGRRGRKRRLDIESEYWLLLASGVGTVEACKQLGIGRKTGYRWRAETGGLPPAALSETSRSQRYLSLLERRRIATLRRDGLGVREIAEQLGRSPSTISRELRRNTAAHDHSYDSELAHARARERARRPRRGVAGRAAHDRQVVLAIWCLRDRLYFASIVALVGGALEAAMPYGRVAAARAALGSSVCSTAQWVRPRPAAVRPRARVG